MVSRVMCCPAMVKSLQLVRTSQPTDENGVHQQFVDRRQRFSEHARRVPAPQETCGLSVYERKYN